MDRLRTLIIALWIALSATAGLLHLQAAPTTLLSAAAFVAGVLSGARVLVALAVALQLPALIAVSLTQSLIHAALLMLATLYVAELGDLAARAKGAHDANFAKAEAVRVTVVTAFALPAVVVFTAAAELISPILDFGIAVLVLALLAFLALALRAWT